jgi:cell division protease FtsH
LNLSYKKLAILIMIGLMLVMLFRVFNQPGNSVSIDYSDFLNMVESGSVIQVTIQGDNISGLTEQGPFHTFAPKDPELITLLRDKGVKISAEPQKGSSWSRVLLSWIPMLLLVAVWIFFMRRAQGGNGNPLSFGKSRAILISDSQGKITFEDVAGIDEAREELQEIVDFLRDPGKFTRLGGRIPKGVLLWEFQAQVRPYWQGLLPVRRVFPFSA